MKMEMDGSNFSEKNSGLGCANNVRARRRLRKKIAQERDNCCTRT